MYTQGFSSISSIKLKTTLKTEKAREIIQSAEKNLLQARAIS